MPSSRALVRSSGPSIPVDLCCENCHTPIPIHVRGLYYSVCPKCGHANYKKA
jgi:Zn finger protein HypA/HybF involved in hydrogenase expression